MTLPSPWRRFPAAHRRCTRAAATLVSGVALLGFLLAAPATDGMPPDAEPQEDEVKAAGLFKIISFVEWPATSFATADAPLVVGVIGRGAAANLLEQFAEGETWHGRKVVVRRFPSSRAAGPCHVLFVGQSEQQNWPLLRPQVAGRPVLTVSDASGFARTGGIVQLATERNRVRLIVNVTVARESGVIISSKVLRLAEVIGGPRS